MTTVKILRGRRFLTRLAYFWYCADVPIPPGGAAELFLLHRASPEEVSIIDEQGVLRVLREQLLGRQSWLAEEERASWRQWTPVATESGAPWRDLHPQRCKQHDRFFCATCYPSVYNTPTEGAES